MYYFHFNKGTVYLPHKKSESLPIIVSTYGRGESHWPKRVEEALRVAVNKQNIGFVVFHEGNPAEMAAWVKPRYFTDPDRVGIFSLGEPVYASDIFEDGLAFSVVTVPHGRDPNTDTFIPTLYLQGTGEKVSLETLKLKKSEIVRRENAGTKSAHVIFKGSDEYLFNVMKYAVDETVRWLSALYTR
ncbi:MAG: hypothetical protein FWE90_02060 [Defluviitaleaceae bacterium]|nr:hypothetical protein [Defluviitaleaceae bacterium]